LSPETRIPPWSIQVEDRRKGPLTRTFVVEVMGLEPNDFYDANVARDPDPARAFLMNTLVFGFQ
jgi:hypothetical protein